MGSFKVNIITLSGTNSNYLLSVRQHLSMRSYSRQRSNQSSHRPEKINIQINEKLKVKKQINSPYRSVIHKATSMLMTYVGDNFGCFSHQLYLEVLASGTNIPTNNIGDNLEILSPISRNF